MTKHKAKLSVFLATLCLIGVASADRRASKEKKMICFLRVSGPDLDVDEVVRRVKLKPLEVFKKGQSSATGRKPEFNTESGVRLNVSEADADHFDALVEGAVEFLHANKTELISLCRQTPRIKSAALYFVVKDQAAEQHFPLPLIEAAAEIGVGIKIAVYAEK